MQNSTEQRIAEVNDLKTNLLPSKTWRTDPLLPANVKPQFAVNEKTSILKSLFLQLQTQQVERFFIWRSSYKWAKEGKLNIFSTSSVQECHERWRIGQLGLGMYRFQIPDPVQFRYPVVIWWISGKTLPYIFRIIFRFLRLVKLV